MVTKIYKIQNKRILDQFLIILVGSTVLIKADSMFNILYMYDFLQPSMVNRFSIRTKFPSSKGLMSQNQSQNLNKRNNTLKLSPSILYIRNYLQNYVMMFFKKL